MSGRSRTEREVKLSVTGDRRAAESLQLEVRRLARRLGLAVTAVRIRRVERRAT